MSGSSDSDDYRRPGKNGTDRSQDRELRELRAELSRRIEVDAEAHAAILAKLSSYETALLVANVREEEKTKAERSLRRQVFALALLFLAQVAGVVSWAAVEFGSVNKAVAANTAHFREFQAIGIEWGDAIDLRHNTLRKGMEEQLAAIREDLRQLRRLVNEHQRNKAEHQK